MRCHVVIPNTNQIVGYHTIRFTYKKATRRRKILDNSYNLIKHLIASSIADIAALWQRGILTNHYYYTIQCIVSIVKYEHRTVT